MVLRIPIPSCVAQPDIVSIVAKKIGYTYKQKYRNIKISIKIGARKIRNLSKDFEVPPQFSI